MCTYMMVCLPPTDHPPYTHINPKEPRGGSLGYGLTAQACHLRTEWTYSNETLYSEL